MKLDDYEFSRGVMGNLLKSGFARPIWLRLYVCNIYFFCMS